MLKLIYDLKAGFDDCYLILKNEEQDLTMLLEIEKHSDVEFAEPDIEESDLDLILEATDEDFYNLLKEDPDRLMIYLEGSGLLYFIKKLSLDKLTRLAGSLFRYQLNTSDEISIWEPSNWRLEYDPNIRSSFYYEDAMSAKEVCDTLKLTRQQLHYYVKSGQLRKEFNPENRKQFKYNRLDAQVLQKKLEKKYDRYK